MQGVNQNSFNKKRFKCKLNKFFNKHEAKHNFEDFIDLGKGKWV